MLTPEIIVKPKGYQPDAAEIKKRHDAKKKGGILYEVDRAIARHEIYEMFQLKQPQESK